MEIQQMRHVLAAAGSSSYAQAAKKCFTSRQNIAHSVKAVESELGIDLFERQGNIMMITEKGRRAVGLIEEIIADIDKLRVLFTELDNRSVMSLAVSVNFFAGMPDGVDEVFIDRADKLQFFEHDCKHCYEMVCDGKVDAAIVMCMDRSFPNCNAMRVGGSIAYALVPEWSSLAEKSGCVPSDFLGRHLVLMSEPPFQYEPLFSRLDQLGFDRTSVSVMPSTSSMIHMLRGASVDTVGIVSRKYAEKPPRGAVSIPIVDGRMNWGFYILHKDSEKSNEQLALFMQAIREAFRKSDLVAARPPSAN